MIGCQNYHLCLKAKVHTTFLHKSIRDLVLIFDASLATNEHRQLERVPSPLKKSKNRSAFLGRGWFAWPVCGDNRLAKKAILLAKWLALLCSSNNGASTEFRRPVGLLSIVKSQQKVRHLHREKIAKLTSLKTIFRYLKGSFVVDENAISSSIKPATMVFAMFLRCIQGLQDRRRSSTWVVIFFMARKFCFISWLWPGSNRFSWRS